MNYIKFLFTFFTAILIFSSCQKEIYSDSDESLSLRVKTYTEDLATPGSGNDVNTYNLSYDSQDRIISLASVDPAGVKFLYQYNSDKTYTLDVYSSNDVTIHAIYFINNVLLVDSSLQYNLYDTTTEKYVYNSLKQLTVKKIYEYTAATGSVLSATHYYKYDLNGNLISDSTESGVTTYTFYDNLLNSTTLGQSYFIKNKNLIKTTTLTTGSGTFTTNHTYTFDNKNRLSTERVEASDGEVLIKTYTYY